MSEGSKETENTRIEKDAENISEIELLYTFDVIIFEHTLLESEKYSYSICWTNPKQIYDVVIEDKQKGKLVKYEVVKKSSPKLSKYFNLIKGEKLVDDGCQITCTSHSIEYKL
ncbi:hypothetical protein [Methanosphaera sp. WGK6]|uniref:hypothetical protein n=1 Tax=Methanosphaera sp. WGK6 TaxID=1561964 RepID=UPI00084C4B49|nr:hypothetical protein [Methanosphaera sp. WGK6]